MFLRNVHRTVVPFGHYPRSLLVYSLTCQMNKRIERQSSPLPPFAGLPLHSLPSTLFLRRTPFPRHSLELHIFLWFPGDWSTTRSKFSEIAQLHWRSDLKSLQAGRRCATNWTQIKPIVNERGTVGSVTGTRVATNGAIINSGNKAQSI